MVDTYIYILNVRFSGDIHFEKKIEDPDLLKLMVPSMILQPVVENSVKYGIRDMEDQGKIELSVFRVDDEVCISIADNGEGISKDKIESILNGSHVSQEDETGNGVGLYNVMQRLSLYFDHKNRFEIISDGPGQGCEVVITIPG